MTISRLFGALAIAAGGVAAGGLALGFPPLAIGIAAIAAPVFGWLAKSPIDHP